jgi:formylglycine-generating enzyme required for sulfatase activity
VNAPFDPPRAFLEFRIVRPLGKGAMGEVFLAEDELLGREVAIKFVRQAERPEMRARFLLEARTLARLQHPNVVTVHRVGEVLGRPFLVSELVKGESLDRLSLPLPGPAALQVAIQLARALAAVHRVGVLHRDLKPANVLLAESGELKLVDFGVSAELEDSDEPTAPPSLAETQPLPGAAPREHGPFLQVGTPLYAAPELLRGGPASRQSELYAWGAVLYEVCAGRAPFAASSLAELRAKAEAGGFAPLRDAPGVLADLVHRCLSPRPQDRPLRAEALLEALEPLSLAAVPDEPYRGLSVFGPEHAALFFGREHEARAVIERLRAASFVLVAGDSGVGKSSLCRAGVLAQLERGALGRRFHVVEASLGARAVEALGAALSPWLGVDERASAAALRSDPEQLAVRVRAAPAEEGRALFIDGLEELVALASSEDAECLGRFLGALAVRSQGFRLVATARSDFLTRLSALPALGPEVGSALYLLRPLTDEGIRQAIEGPARAAGFRFVPEPLVDELVSAAKGPGALPLMQFALAELWRKRDPVTKVIAREALLAIGGVGGALARHADGTVAALPEAQRSAAEEILRRLVTAQGTRARRLRGDFPEGNDFTQALSALTSARLLIARDAERKDATYELAHEALIQSWDQLRAWIGRDAEKRALAQRVERAAEEWERLGQGGEGLWSRRQLREVERFPALEIGERERRFLGASRAGARRKRALFLLAAFAVPALLALVVSVARSRHREEAAVRLRAATGALERARALDAEEAALLPGVFQQFDAGESEPAERAWTRVRGIRARIAEELGAARGSVESAQLLAPSEEAARLSADLIAFRLEREHGNPLSRERESLLAQIDGARRAAFDQPARLRVDARSSLLSGAAPIALEPGREREVKPGSYVLELPDTKLPLLLRSGDRRDIRVTPAAIPAGFIHVPAGRFLSGFDGDEDVRLGFFGAAPLHERETPAFLIARTETTFAEWLTWLRSLPPAERARRLPRAETLRNGLSLSQRPDGRFVLRMKPTATPATYQAVEGEPLTYRGRKKNASVDWRRFPVSGISFADALAYSRWFSSRVPGARLCREEEWERAARGADGRSFPAGDALAGDDANIDETYGRDPLGFGPDEVGSHPRSDSPVGAADMAGNVWEMTVSSRDTPALRGGSWYQGALTARSVNREPYEPTARDLLIGFRVCASVQ